MKLTRYTHYKNEVGLGTHTTQMKMYAPLKAIMLKKLI